MDSEFDFNPLGVWFGPDEAGVDQVDLGESFQPLEADGQEFAGLEGTGHPAGWGLEVPDERERRKFS